MAACWLGRPLPSPDRGAPISHGWGADLADRATRDEREKCSSRREGAIEFYSIIQSYMQLSAPPEIALRSAATRDRASRE